MTKSIVAGVIALILVVGCGVCEVYFLHSGYKYLHDECEQVIELAQSRTLTTEQFCEFRDKWVKLRETSELLLPHQDVYELNLRFAESQAYAEQKDYEQLLAHLFVIEELLLYVPHLMTPSLNHLV